MKKLAVILMTVIMVMGMSFAVSAENGGFVSSPSGNSAPTISESKPLDDDCSADLKITSYSDRNSLSAKERQAMENAYSSIKKNKNLSNLNSGISTIAKNKGLSTKNLAVSDLFNVGCSGCSDHANHKGFNIKLSAETLKNFVCLLRYRNNKWEIVEGASIEGGQILFQSDANYPFAVVVDTSAGGPATGENSNMIIFYVAIMAISATLSVVLWRKSRK